MVDMKNAQALKATLFIPVLNEIDGLKTFLPQIPKNLFDQTLICDGQSTDGSADWAKANGYEVYVQKKRGIRYAYIEAWNLIRNPIVVTFSPDGNCQIDDLKPLIDKISEGYDMVIGSRYINGLKSSDDTAITSFGNKIFTWTINFLYRASLTDAMTIFRVYKTNLFAGLDLDKDQSYWTENMFGTVMGIEPLLTVRALKRNLKIGEIPAFEPKRAFGKAKLQVFRWGASYMSQIIWERFFWK